MLLATRDSTPPRFSTPLTPGRPNLVKPARAVAKMLGFRRLSPWQDDFLALATEYEEGDPHGGIVPYWRNVVLTIPRQCGKSECICSILYVLRWMGYYLQDEDPKMVYTTFSLEAAIDQWKTKIGKRIHDSQWGQAKGFLFREDKANLHARLGQSVKMVGGRIRVLSNSGKSGRGGSEDFVVLDEAREFGDDSSREKTLTPLMNQRPSPQFLVCSTMGLEDAGYFNRKVHAGRETARAQSAGDWPRHRLAYVEYGMGAVAPDEYDPGDPKVWLSAHPMLGHGYWTGERMSEAYDLARAEDDVGRFQQEYLNQMFEASQEPAVPWEMLEAVEEERVGWDRLGERVVLAIHSEPGGYYLSAVAAGGGCLRVVRPADVEGEIRRVPVYRVEDWLGGWLEKHPQVREVVFREGTDLEAVLGRYRRKGVRMSAMKFGDWKPGCQSLKKAMVQETVVIEHSRFLRMAVAACEVVESVYSDQAAWFWNKRKEAEAPADELIAAVLAWTHWERIARRKPGGVVDLAALVGSDGGADTEEASSGDETMSDSDRERLAQWQKIYSGG